LKSSVPFAICSACSTGSVSAATAAAAPVASRAEGSVSKTYGQKLEHQSGVNLSSASAESHAPSGQIYLRRLNRALADASAVYDNSGETPRLIE
jgi:hypothetical protein